ncbi:MAG: PQQ-binding-like beta-propeller repeat protein [Polyangiales bacterium]
MRSQRSVMLTWSALALCAWTEAGCSSSNGAATGPAQSAGSAGGVSGAASPAVAGAAGSSGASGTSVGGSGGAAGAIASQPATGGAPARAPGDVPCEIADFLEQHCVDCHGQRPRLGAPVSLVTASSFKIMGMSGLPLTQVVGERLQNMERPMPPQALLPAADIAPIMTWLNAGATPDPAGCEVRDPHATGAAGSGGTAAPSGGAGAPVGPVDVPADDAAAWSMFGGDLGNTRTNAGEKTLSVQNVSGLQELWTYSGAGVTASPAVAGGVLYLPTWSGQVVALDARTGAQRWMTKLPDLIDSSPALSPTQVFVSDDQGSVHALARADGVLQWSKQVDTHAEAHLWSSPIYVPGSELILVGVASGEEAVAEPYSFRGSVVALDAKTGEERWKFYTTPGDATSGPGVGVWATVAVDTTRKLAFVGTGNAYAGVAGQYVDSMLALDYESGALQWFKQFTAGDVYTVRAMTGPDFDIGASANVYSAGGKDILGVGIKSGDYVALDRETGQPLWMTHITDGSVQGGIISSPAVGDGKVFVASNVYPVSVTLAALDATSGSVAWMSEVPMGVAYGGVIYANGVVYLGTTNGAITAYDGANGKQLWTATAPDSIAGGPSIANGVLYVPWGYMWTLREGGDAVGGLIAYGLK